MKNILVSIFMLCSVLTASKVQARQYSQCSVLGADLYAVVNLTTKNGGTLFLTAGAETDLQKLVGLELASEQNGILTYKLTAGDLVGILEFPAAVMGNSSDNLKIILKETGNHYEFNCFSRVYPTI